MEGIIRSPQRQEILWVPCLKQENYEIDNVTLATRGGGSFLHHCSIRIEFKDLCKDLPALWYPIEWKNRRRCEFNFQNQQKTTSMQLKEHPPVAAPFAAMERLTLLPRFETTPLHSFPVPSHCLPVATTLTSTSFQFILLTSLGYCRILIHLCFRLELVATGASLPLDCDCRLSVPTTGEGKELLRSKQR